MEISRFWAGTRTPAFSLVYPATERDAPAVGAAQAFQVCGSWTIEVTGGISALTSSVAARYGLLGASHCRIKSHGAEKAAENQEEKEQNHATSHILWALPLWRTDAITKNHGGNPFGLHI